MYPFLVFLHVFGFLSSVLLWFSDYFSCVFFFVFFSLEILLFVWFKDVMYEGLAGYHNVYIQSGLKLSFLFFLFSELMFFVSIFWAYFDSVLVPSVELGASWPPFGVSSPHYMGLPLLNTLLLISSGATVTWGHSNLLMNKSAATGLGFTILLASVFLFVQLYEYLSLGFSMSDSAYGSIFFFGTGFHGFHVLLGTAFLSYGYFWMSQNLYSYSTHLSLECAILYWHFVDVVWLFLYLFVYWWGN